MIYRRMADPDGVDGRRGYVLKQRDWFLAHRWIN